MSLKRVFVTLCHLKHQSSALHQQYLLQHIPALGRSDVQNSAIRLHYYPEGGWGWVVVLSTFLCNALTTGLLLSGPDLSHLSPLMDPASSQPVVLQCRDLPWYY